MNKLIYTFVFLLFLPVTILGFSWGLLCLFFGHGKLYAMLEMACLTGAIKEEIKEGDES